MIARAHAAGVNRIIAVGQGELNDTAEKSGCPFATDDGRKGSIAIGEIALDENYATDVAKFQAELELAKHLNLPVVIHTRGMDDATLGCLKEIPSRGVIHCFTGSVPFCRELLDLGFFISISGIVTFKKADNVREAALYVPDDRILIETDSPYLAPVPMRGKRNEPGFLMHTAKFLADLRKTTLAQFENLTDENANRCFSL